MVSRIEDLPAHSTVYISGPMTGIPLYNWPAFEDAARRLRELGHTVLSPTELDEEAGDVLVFREHYTDPGVWPKVVDVQTTATFDFRATIERDLLAVDESDAVYMLKGWDESLGARIELDRAKALGLRVVYEDNPWAGWTESDPIRKAQQIAVDAGWGEALVNGQVVLVHPSLGNVRLTVPADLDDLDSYIDEQMQDPEFAAAFEAAEDSTNPKDRIGVTKPQLHLVPPALRLYAAAAMKDGAEKYGPYNWREKAVRAVVYYDAACRHLDAWFDGENEAEDSGAHHLGHAAACIGILLDALATGNLIDDRPTPGATARLIADMTEAREAS